MAIAHWLEDHLVNELTELRHRRTKGIALMLLLALVACVLLNHPKCKVDVMQLPEAKRSDVRILTVDTFDTFAEENSRECEKAG